MHLKWLGVNQEYQNPRNGTDGPRYGEAALIEAILTSATIFDVSGGYGLVLTPEENVEGFYAKYDFVTVGDTFGTRMIMPAQTIFDFREKLKDKFINGSSSDAEALVRA